MVPGIVAKHAVIQDACRDAHGDTGAFHKAAFQLLAEYIQTTAVRGDEKGLDYHLVLTVEDTKKGEACRCRSYFERTGKHAPDCPLGEAPSQYPLLEAPIRPHLKPRGGHMASMPEPVVDRSDRARRPTERLTRTPVSSVTPPAGSDASATGTLTPEVEGKLHDAAQEGKQPSVRAEPIVIEGKPDDSSGGAEYSRAGGRMLVTAWIWIQDMGDGSSEALVFPTKALAVAAAERKSEDTEPGAHNHIDKHEFEVDACGRPVPNVEAGADQGVEGVCNVASSYVKPVGG